MILQTWLARRNPNERERKLIRACLPPGTRDRNPSEELLRVRAGDQLARRIRYGVLNRENLLIYSDPGVGKTYTIEQVLGELKGEGKIAGFLTLTATKSIMWSDWFENKITIGSVDGKPVLDLLPAVFANSGAATTNADELSFILFIDEVTRANIVLLDGFLEAIESATYLVEGKKVKLNIRYIFAGNMPGSDASTSTLSPALRSRMHETVILFSADVDIMAGLYLPVRFRKHAKECGYDLPMPSSETLKLMSVVWILLNGWPLERPCYAETPTNLLRLIEELVAADPVLKADLEDVARYSYRGPDARKPLQWLEIAMGRAARRGRSCAVTVDDLMESVARVMRGGYRSKLNEDRQRKELKELDRATYRVAYRLFHSEVLQEIVRRSDGPFGVACRLAPDLKTSPEAVVELLWTYAAELEKRDPTAAHEHFRRFALLARSTAAAPESLMKAARDGWLNADGSFRSTADRKLCRALAELSPKTGVGGAFAMMGTQPVAVRERLRDLLQGSKHAYEFAPEWYRIVARRPELVPRLEHAIQLVDDILGGRQTEPADLAFRPLLQLLARNAKPESARLLRKATPKPPPRPRPEHTPLAVRASRTWTEIRRLAKNGNGHRIGLVLGFVLVFAGLGFAFLNREAETAVDPDTLAKIAMIEERVRKDGGRVGGFQVILAWDGHDDLDLSVATADGTNIHHAAKRSLSCGGELLEDANAAPLNLQEFPFETIVWPQECRPAGPIGIYVRNRPGQPACSNKPVPFRIVVRDGNKTRLIAGSIPVQEDRMLVGEVPVR